MRLLSKGKKKGEEGSPHWMTTFSDMMTLLLVFFVLLYSFSVIDIEKFQRFMASFQGVGILNRGSEPLDQIKQHDYEIPSVEEQRLNDVNRLSRESQMYLRVKQYIAENDLDSEVTVRMVEKGVALEIKDRVLFDTGKAYLKPEALQLLEKLAGLLKDIDYMISIEGHTDNRPIHNERFPSNWELSTARAVSVVRFFTEELGLDPRKFSAVGYGEYHPEVPNDSPENMAINRRVVIVINSRDPYLK